MPQPTRRTRIVLALMAVLTFVSIVVLGFVLALNAGSSTDVAAERGTPIAPPAHGAEPPARPQP